MNTKTKTNLAWGHINGGITGRGDTNTRPRLLIIFCYSAAEGQGDRVPNAVWYSRVMMDTTVPWSNRAVHRNDGKENWLRADKEAKPELIQTLLKRKVDKHSSSLPGESESNHNYHAWHGASLLKYLSTYISARILHIKRSPCAPSSQTPSSSYTTAQKYTHTQWIAQALLLIIASASAAFPLLHVRWTWHPVSSYYITSAVVL